MIDSYRTVADQVAPHPGTHEVAQSALLCAMARKLAVIMHRMWLDDSTFRFATAETQTPNTSAAQPVLAWQQ